MKSTRWQLDGTSFDALLAALGRERGQASEEYERLRQKLVRYFALHGVAFPEDLADEALNRLARKIGEGERIRRIPRYLGGIARILLQEEWYNKLRQEEAVRSSGLNAAGAGDASSIDALVDCLRFLPPEQRAFIERYYSADGRARIEVRRQMAQDLGISLNTLRNRALRIRQDLAECCQKSLGGSTGT